MSTINTNVPLDLDPGRVKILDGYDGSVADLLGETETVLSAAGQGTAPIPQQIEAVLAAVAGSVLAPDVGQTIISSLGTLADARAVAELEARITTLEQKEIG